jgi:hypothetical protein
MIAGDFRRRRRNVSHVTHFAYLHC